MSADPGILRIDNRLKLAAEFVRSGSFVVDVGTDHGKLLAYLILNNISRGGIAADINEKPLAKAAELFGRLNITDRVALLQTDGLEGIDGSQVDDIVIAGMGGELIMDIISGSPDFHAPDKRFILQPMSKPEKLREYLFKSGFSILEEKATSSSGRLYSCILARFTGRRYLFRPHEIYTGGLQPSKDKYAKPYLTVQLNRLYTKLEGLKTAGGHHNQIAQLRLVIDRMEEFIKQGE